MDISRYHQEKFWPRVSYYIVSDPSQRQNDYSISPRNSYGSLDRAMQATRSSSEWTTGRRLKEVDLALPGKHVKLLYGTLIRAEAQVLAQLRTGHSKL